MIVLMIFLRIIDQRRAPFGSWTRRKLSVRSCSIRFENNRKSVSQRGTRTICARLWKVHWSGVQLFERLASLGIMGDQLNLNPSIRLCCDYPGAFQGSPWYQERDASFSGEIIFSGRKKVLFFVCGFCYGKSWGIAPAWLSTSLICSIRPATKDRLRYSVWRVFAQRLKTAKK